jgi:hypothetical protein
MTIRTLLMLSLSVGAPASLSAQVSWDRILHADQEPQNWLTYSVNGNQYITVAAGSALFAFALRQEVHVLCQ